MKTNLPPVFPRVRDALRRRGSSTQDAEDIVQEAWVRLARYEREQVFDKPEAFMMQTAPNRAIDEHRGRVTHGEQVVLEEVILVDDSPPVEAVVLGRERMARLHYCLGRLTEKSRDILLAHRLDGLTYREIADHHDLSISPVTTTFASMDSWQTMALCSHYFSTHFEEQPVEVHAVGNDSAKLTVTWAVGVLADGDWEALGAWPGVGVGPAFWRGIGEDLDSRGVDKISLVCASDLDARVLCPVGKVLLPFRRILGEGYVPAASSVGVLRAEARRFVRDASGVRAARMALERLLAGSGPVRTTVLAPDWPEVLDGFRPFYALRPHRRALVRAGDEYLEQLGLLLSRAVARHGPFADLASAVSFVAQTTSRNERRLKASALVLPAFPACPSGPVSTFGAGGFSGSVGGCSP